MLSTKPTMRQSVRRFASAPVRHSCTDGTPSIGPDDTSPANGSTPRRSEATRMSKPIPPPPTRIGPPTPPRPRASSTCDGSRRELSLKVTPRSPCTSGARGRLGLSRLRLLFRKQPRQRLGHRTDERRVLLARQLWLGKKAEGRAERRALRAVADVAVLVLPRDERAAAALGQLEERAAISVPALAEVSGLDRLERGALRLVILVEAGALVTLPAPPAALDPADRERADVGDEPLEGGLVDRARRRVRHRLIVRRTRGEPTTRPYGALRDRCPARAAAGRRR